jgi:hypothetical protein
MSRIEPKPFFFFKQPIFQPTCVVCQCSTVDRNCDCCVGDIGHHHSAFVLAQSVQSQPQLDHQFSRHRTNHPEPQVAPAAQGRASALASSACAAAPFAIIKIRDPSIETVLHLRQHSHVPSRASSASANRPLSSDIIVNNSRKLRLPIMPLHDRDKSAFQLFTDDSTPACAFSTDSDQGTALPLADKCYLRA